MSLFSSIHVDHENNITVVATDSGAASVRVSAPDFSASFNIVFPYGTSGAAVQKIADAISDALAPRREELARKIREAA